MKRLAIAFLALLATSCGSSAAPLKVCADPNNLPFSNHAGEGFENKLAEQLAAGLKRPLQTVWWAQRRGFVRNTVGAGTCDVWLGVASGLETLATTRPYYRSSYMFVSRANRPLSGLTLDDPRLRKLKVGVQLIGDDGSNTPPAHALARRGLAANLRGFTLYGDYRTPEPTAEIVHAVEDGRVDVAIVWGPLAGFVAGRSRGPLRVEPVQPWLDENRWPMAYDISVGVRKGDPRLLAAVERWLGANRKRVDVLLAQYRVPRLDARGPL